MNFKAVQQLFPSEDGNKLQQIDFLNYIETIIMNMDDYKDPNKSTLKRMPIYTAKFFSISPYTEVEHLDDMVDAIERSIHELEGKRNEVIC